MWLTCQATCDKKRGASVAHMQWTHIMQLLYKFRIEPAASCSALDVLQGDLPKVKARLPILCQAFSWERNYCS
jgi:hypothetical protein